MSSVSSWCALSCSDDNNAQDSWSFVSSNKNNKNSIDLDSISQQIKEKDIIVVNANQTADDDDYTDDFEHISQHKDHSSYSMASMHSKQWSNISSSLHDFDVRSIPSVQSRDTVKDNFIFTDYNFEITKKNKRKPRWLWLRKNDKKMNKNRFRNRSNRPRRKHSKKHSVLCDIDESMELKEGVPKEVVVNIKDLNEILNEEIFINDNINDVIKLCNICAVDGVINIRNTTIQLHETPLIGLKLRDVFFRKLVLLNENLRDYENGNVYVLRRSIWIKLSLNARLFLIPFGSFDEFRELYNVHESVKCNEFLSVIDEESFHILERYEWIRCLLFKSYLNKIRNDKYLMMIKQKEYEEKLGLMQEVQSLYSLNQDINKHYVQLQQKQISIIMTDVTNQAYSQFEASERQFQDQLRLESELLSQRME